MFFSRRNNPSSTRLVPWEIGEPSDLVTSDKEHILTWPQSTFTPDAFIGLVKMFAISVTYYQSCVLPEGYTFEDIPALQAEGRLQTIEQITAGRRAAPFKHVPNGEAKDLVYPNGDRILIARRDPLTEDKFDLLADLIVLAAEYFMTYVLDQKNPRQVHDDLKAAGSNLSENQFLFLIGAI